MGSNKKNIGRVSKSQKTGTGTRKTKKKQPGSSLPSKSTKATNSIDNADAPFDDEPEMVLLGPRPRPKALLKPKALGATASDAGLLLNFKGQAMSVNDAINASLGIGADEAREIEAEEKAEAAAKRQKGKGKEIELSSEGGDTNEEDGTSNDDETSSAAKKMQVSISHLSGLAYTPSWIPKSHKPVPTLLADEEDYEGMLEKIDEFRAECRSKNHGKGKVKEYTIVFTDVSESSESSGKKSKKNAKEKPAIAVEPQTDKGTTLMKAIAAANGCEQHEKKVCFVMPDSTHYQLTNEDLVDAASLVIMGKATVDNAIEKLKLEDNIEKTSKQAAIKKNVGMGMMGGFIRENLLFS
uniref:Uncharacterized protein n=1 Tax=Mycena chlorophos TaxID=658473 RepID=A0ABQ0MB73_MYCCL|nr:predicted protein [Mycena chlorophos]